MVRQPAEREKIAPVYQPGKDFKKVSKDLSHYGPHHPANEQAMEFNRHFSKEETQMADKCLK